MQHDLESRSMQQVAQKELNTTETPRQQEAQKQKRPSPKSWHLVLIGGDGVLFVALLAFVLILTPGLSLPLDVPVYSLGSWNGKIIWACLSLFSWCLAAKSTQTHNPAHATGRLISVLHVLFALTLTSIIWMALTYPFFIS